MSNNEVVVGAQAPELRVSRFLKGTPFTSFAPGSVYVVELWATWCGPCLESMPHLTELQATYPEITILGVAVMEESSDALDEFVSERSDLMGYAIAEDLPSEEEGGLGWMHGHWLHASYLEGIPTAFIVNGAGRIAWIGQPMEIDDALAAVVNDIWDLDAQTKIYEETLIESGVRESRALGAAIAAARKVGDLQAALQACNEAFATSPALEAKMCAQKITLLTETDRDAFPAYARHLADTINVPNAEAYRSIGMSLYVAASAEGVPQNRYVTLVARDFLKRAEAIIFAGHEPQPFHVAVTKRGLGEILLALDDVEDALTAATSARDWILKVDAPFMVEHIDNLIERCKGAAAKNIQTPPAVICDGDTCRIA